MHGAVQTAKAGRKYGSGEQLAVSGVKRGLMREMWREGFGEDEEQPGYQWQLVSSQP